MAAKVKRLQTDVVIAGSGPGGCAIAKELAKKGKRVILVEKGSSSKHMLGTPLGAFWYMEKGSGIMPVRKTTEGDALILGQGVGGGSILYGGEAYLPDLDYWRAFGVDIPKEIVDETAEECWVSMPPDEFVGPGTKRLWEAGNDFGFRFEKHHRAVDFSKCKVGCEKCIYGCPRGAKWTGRVFADEAMRNGATLLTHVKVADVIIEKGVAGGVRATGRRGQRYEINAKVVVCSAGGIHTAEILKKSGFEEAGSWVTADPAPFTFGFVKEGRGNGFEHNMTIGYDDKEHGVAFLGMLEPFLAWHLQLLQDEPFKWVTRLHRFRKALGLSCKFADEGVGHVAANGQVSKTFTNEDRAKLKYCRSTSEKILTRAGCDPNDIHHTSFALGHPGGTVRVGRLLDANLETSVRNLYCCDTSVLPAANATPPVMTVVALGKRLARRLDTIA